MAEEHGQLLRAGWLAAMDRPLLRDGAVVFAGGRVVAGGPYPALRRAHPAAILIDYGDAVLLPGLVNAHTHLELTRLSTLRRASPPSDAWVWGFATWLRMVFEQTRNASAADTAGAVADGVAQCLRFGVTAVGDVSRDVSVARQALAGSPLGGVSFGEVVGMAARRRLAGPRIAAAVEPVPPGGRVRPGISPHAPYSIDADNYGRCLDAARDRGLALTTHLAESAEETQFLSDHAGPFRELWDRIGAWDNSVPRFEGGPVRFARSLGLLDYPVASLAHVNYCDDEELALLASGVASVVYCPRTHAYFGHPPHRWREMLAAGVNVAVGTDSCASSPDLNLVDELRLLHRLAPDVPPETLWEMATMRAARALGVDGSAGTLAAGREADCAVFPASTEDPLREILETGTAPLAVWAGGREVFKAARRRRPRG